MIEIRRILCPIDFSDGSRRALGLATAIAHAYGATVTLFHMEAFQPVGAWGPGAPGFSPTPLPHTEREGLLASLRQFAGDAAPAPLEFDAGIGEPVPGILAKAEGIGCDLLVMGTHGRSGFDRLVLGSVAEKVLRKARCPVLTVPPHLPDAVPATPALFGRILCAVDFSPCSARALEYAASLAERARSRLTVLHVLELPDMPEASRALSAYLAPIEAERRAQLEAAVPDSARRTGGLATVLVKGTPYREILARAAGDAADLIVLGIHGRNAADLLFFGSTAQHVVRQATCPVLTLRR